MVFICRECTTQKTEEWFNNIFEHFDPNGIRSAWLKYDKMFLTDYNEKKEAAPLQIYGKTKNGEPLEIYIFSATAGYYGAGPEMAYNIIKKLGFDLTYEDIVNGENQITNLIFEK